MRILAAMMVMAICVGTCQAGEPGNQAGAPGGKPVPFRVVPIEQFGAVAKNWPDESLPHYNIMNHVGEWELAFQPVGGAGGNRPFTPNPAVFEKAQLVAISRVSAAPQPGHQVLRVKSLEIVDGELVLSYVFVPPANPSGQKVKNTIIVAYPTDVHNPLRISEDTETAGSRFAQSELEEALREGRFKAPAPAPGAPRQ